MVFVLEGEKKGKEIMARRRFSSELTSFPFSSQPLVKLIGKLVKEAITIRVFRVGSLE